MRATRVGSIEDRFQGRYVVDPESGCWNWSGARNGFGSSDPAKYTVKPIAQEVIDHIRSTPPRTYGLSKLYGLSNVTISKIRRGITRV